MQPAVRHSLKPRLVAIAPTAAEAVECAGGWLFDQVLAGWDATVITQDEADHRSLQILGVRGHTLESALAYHADGSCLSMIATSAALFDSDERVRHMVLAAVDSGLPELRLWGERSGDGAGVPIEPASRAAVAHRLSAAARAFKAQALAAADMRAGRMTDTEVFRRGEIRQLLGADTRAAAH